jgi:hypothetical protein
LVATDILIRVFFSAKLCFSFKDCRFQDFFTGFFRHLDILGGFRSLQVFVAGFCCRFCLQVLLAGFFLQALQVFFLQDFLAGFF